MNKASEIINRKKELSPLLVQLLEQDSPDFEVVKATGYGAYIRARQSISIAPINQGDLLYVSDTQSIEGVITLSLDSKFSRFIPGSNTYGILRKAEEEYSDQVLLANIEQVRSTKDLPEWFKLEKYEQFSLDNEVDLLWQLRYRTFLYREVTDSSWRNDRVRRDTTSRQWKELCLYTREDKGLAELYSNGMYLYYKQFEEKTGRKTLPQHSHVRPLSPMEIRSFHKKTKHASNLIDSENRLETWGLEALRSYDAEFGSGNAINIKLALRAPDSVLLDEIRVLLPVYRKILNQPEPELTFKKTDPQKIIDYRVIPIIDLYIWGLIERKKVPNSVIAAAIFQYGEKGDYELRKTIAPFIDRITSSYFTYEWEMFIAN